MKNQKYVSVNNSAQKNIGIFGGTFNPPHIAHSIAADSVREQLKLDKIIFIPSGIPPLKESIPVEHRLAMTKLAFGNDKNFEVSEIEIRNTGEKSYTVNTLQTLNDLYKNENVKLFLIIGVDKLLELPKWKNPERLFELSQVIVINRPGFSAEDAKPEFAGRVTFVSIPFMEISSSIIRKNVLGEISIKYLVVPEVEEYIKKNNLYK